MDFKKWYSEYSEKKLRESVDWFSRTDANDFASLDALEHGMNYAQLMSFMNIADEVSEQSVDVIAFLNYFKEQYEKACVEAKSAVETKAKLYVETEPYKRAKHVVETYEFFLLAKEVFSDYMAS
jgi:hypothetical protein